ncbi:MAG: endolytic transglycosylase MltG [Anaerolineales bacterium]|nr:endolytic transglycosylase MltG [Anaerolineales bacterium]MCX7754696.1 endolytic transglycosylase MltG [Anaerolineales bacterium]MDW8278897.1 endolytic transglycosylase MltG [Anaerolineales bacterium]
MNSRRPRRRKWYLPAGCLALGLAAFAFTAAVYLLLPYHVARTYGPPGENIRGLQRFRYAALILWYGEALTQPRDSRASEAVFRVQPGEGAAAVALRLEREGFIRSAEAFSAYLVYSGLDRSIQAGEFTLSPALAPLQIAQKLQDATPTQIKFVVLAGWRLEEVAAALPTSGFSITPAGFLNEARRPARRFDFLPEGATAEGFLLPGAYTLPRDLSARELVETLMNNFALALSPELRAAFERQGLSVYQAVILASIVQREAMQAEEQPLIASVFLNRLAAGMKLETDPTVQYAIGLNPATGSWWKSPLSLVDLQINSPYNTYQNAGLPPGPICSPALSALQAVAYPAQTPYYFFRARCDGSGLHTFAETFEQHLRNACP